jgi:hypothetical protein
MPFNISITSANTIPEFRTSPENFLPGFTPDRPGLSARDLRIKFKYGDSGRPGNGWYWIKPNQQVSSILTYCDFTTEGGGWTLWRSYSYQRQSTLNRTNCNERTIQYQDGFNLFEVPYDWKMAITPAGKNREFLFYVSANGEFDSTAANNYAVVLPTTSVQDFFQGSGTSVAIPCYGKIRGSTFYNTPYTATHINYWWYNTSSFEVHTDSGHIPGAVSSEDNFGYYGSINNTSWPVNSYTLKFVR